jgi:hypothetical protein
MRFNRVINSQNARKNGKKSKNRENFSQVLGISTVLGDEFDAGTDAEDDQGWDYFTSNVDEDDGNIHLLDEVWSSGLGLEDWDSKRVGYYVHAFEAFDDPNGEAVMNLIYSGDEAKAHCRDIQQLFRSYYHLGSLWG